MRQPILVLLLLALSGCAHQAAVPVLTMTMPLPAASFSISQPLRDFLLPAGSGAQAAADPAQKEALRALLRTDATDESVTQAVADGRLALALVELDRGELRFEGRTLARLQGFEIPADLQRGGTIAPLFDALKEAADDARAVASQDPSLRFSGRILLAIHPEAPFETVRQIMSTCGQAQFADFRFLVGDDHPVARRPEPSGDRKVSIVAHADGTIDVTGSGDGGPLHGQAEALDELLIAVLGDADRLGCATITTDGSAWSAQVMALEDSLLARGVTPALVAGTTPSTSGAPLPSADGPWTWRIGDGVPVRAPGLPVLGDSSGAGECGPHGMVKLGALVKDAEPSPAAE